jgi:hypothetical protein
MNKDDEERRLLVAKILNRAGSGDVDAASRLIKIWSLPGPSYFNLTENSLADTLVRIFLSKNIPKDLKKVIWKSRDNLVYTEITTSEETRQISAYNIRKDEYEMVESGTETITTCKDYTFYEYITRGRELDDIIRTLKS